jgi:tRNA U34 2-thiouridine synthase MnmA/TrmU
VKISNIIFSGMAAPTEECEETFEVKLRYTAPPVRASAHIYPDGRATLCLETPQKFAPGQSAVLYRDGVVMLGGFIDG